MRVWPLFLLTGCVMASEPLIIDVSAPPPLSAPTVKAQSVSQVDIEVILPPQSTPIRQPAKQATPQPEQRTGIAGTQPSPTASPIPAISAALAGVPPTRLGPPAPVLSPSVFPSPTWASATPSPAPASPLSTPVPVQEWPALVEQTQVIVPATEYFVNQPSNAVVREAQFQITYAPTQWIFLYGGPFVVKGETRCCIGGDSVNMKVFFNERVVFDAQDPARQDGLDLTPYALPGTLNVKVRYTNDTTGGGTLAPLTLKVLNLQPPPVFNPELKP